MSDLSTILSCDIQHTVLRTDLPYNASPFSTCSYSEGGSLRGHNITLPPRMFYHFNKKKNENHIVIGTRESGKKLDDVGYCTIIFAQ